MIPSHSREGLKLVGNVNLRYHRENPATAWAEGPGVAEEKWLRKGMDR